MKKKGINTLKTSKELSQGCIDFVTDSMKNSDMLELELTSSLPIQNAIKTVEIFREWIESAQNPFHWSDLGNGNIVFWKDRANTYMQQHLINGVLAFD